MATLNCIFMFFCYVGLLVTWKLENLWSFMVFCSPHRMEAKNWERV